MKTNEAGFLRQNRAIKSHSVDRINPVQNVKLNMRLPGRLQTQAHGAGVSVKAAANILDIEHQRIKVFDLFRRRFGRLAIEAVRSEEHTSELQSRVDISY